MQEVITQLKKTKAASIELRTLSADSKNQVLLKLILKLQQNETKILEANLKDVKAYESSSGFQKAYADRLALNPGRLKQMIESLQAVIAAADPVGQSMGQSQLHNALMLDKVRGPIGVCFMIFESRPNVITEAFSLALKSGNAVILKGGKESDLTAQCLYALITESIRESHINENIFWGLVGASRQTTDFLMKQYKLIDVLIPRGGDRLIEYVTENSYLPLIKNDRGLCHIYVHENANIEMAVAIIDNAKTQRPGVCNSAETLLVDASIAQSFLPKMYSVLSAKGVEFYVCALSHNILSNGQENLKIHLANEANYDTEYLDLKLNVKIVNSLSEAKAHIETHGSRHSEAIITEDKIAAEDFLKNVDAAVVYWNASTRFTDGYQFGLGGEMGISTQKLHVRGPVGLEALTVPRWIVRGQGQVRS